MNQKQFTIKSTYHSRAAYRNFAIATGAFLISFFIAGVLAPVESSNAITCTSGSTGTDGEICDVAGTDVSVIIDNPYYITIANTLTKVDLDYSTSDTNLGHILTTSDTITTTSNTGQTKYLYISTTHDSTTTYANNLINDNTDLTNNKTYIKAGGGNTLDTATSLTDNTWGFSIDNLKEANVFTKVPVLGNELLLQEEVGTETIDEDTKAGTGEYVSTKDVYYGVLATTDLYAGKYSNTIKYTAFTTEPPEGPPVINSCSELAVNELGVYNDYEVQKLADNRCWMTSDYQTSASWTSTSCPSGFSRPSSSDFQSLINAVGSGGQLYALGWNGLFWTTTPNRASGLGDAMQVTNNVAYVGSDYISRGNQVRCYASN